MRFGKFIVCRPGAAFLVAGLWLAGVIFLLVGAAVQPDAEGRFVALGAAALCVTMSSHSLMSVVIVGDGKIRNAFPGRRWVSFVEIVEIGEAPAGTGSAVDTRLVNGEIYRLGFPIDGFWERPEALSHHVSEFLDQVREAIGRSEPRS